LFMYVQKKQYWGISCCLYFVGKGRPPCFPYGQHWSNTYVEGGWKGTFNPATRWSWPITSIHRRSVCCNDDGSGRIPSFHTRICMYIGWQIFIHLFCFTPI
jgi:hypothetical protein